MRTIPQIRERLHELAVIHGIPELATLAEETKRRPPARRARAKRKVLTPTLITAIQAYAAAHPSAHYDDIAKVFDVNPGRVSEALNGKR